MRRGDFVTIARVHASLKLNPKKRAVLGQYMTPTPIGHFMAGLFSGLRENCKILWLNLGFNASTLV